MGEDSEKRFEAIMNKLFHGSPKSKLNKNTNSRHGVQSSRGKKPLNSSSTSVSMGMRITGSGVDEPESSMSASATSSRALLRRPWDRDDLFGRLSTFKSMTWFAKPQVVSPLNCARRGWINVDMDTIACTSCGARLLFSTPTAWTLQQVEKAAMVFSLKLESGHKLLCPWIISACPEELAQFPTVSRADLVEDYKKRVFALSQLIALPIIPPVAIDNMRSPMLEQFLREFSTSEYCVPVETSRIEHVGDVPGSISSISYYQAQKLISLCGWEPHMLPYIVDFKDEQNQSIRDTNVMDTNGKRQKVSVSFLACANEDPKVSAELQFDPSSVVLNCNLCGTNVGLWAFCTVPRPVEHIRLVGFTEINGINGSSPDEITALEGSSGHVIHAGSREGVTNAITTASTSLGITIAGGPPPAMLNYNAAISLPVIGQSLRERLPMETESKDRLSQVDKGQNMSPEGVNVTTDESLVITGPDFIAKNSLEVPQNIAEVSCLNVNMLENETVRTDRDLCRFYVGGFSCATPEVNFTSKNGGPSEANKEDMVEAKNCEQDTYHSDCQDSGGTEAFTKHSPFIMREYPKLPLFNKAMEFDPIKQHRHFCPWIASGWQQTLSALQGHKEFSFSSLSNVRVHSAIEVDDPIASVKKLFTSPNEKRTKVLDGI